jgi:DNA polymerase III delta prime subunit
VQAVKALASKAKGDIRSCLNTLQLLAARHTSILPQHVHDTAFGQKDMTDAPLEVLDSLLLARKRRGNDMYSNLMAFGEHSLVCTCQNANVIVDRIPDFDCDLTRFLCRPVVKRNFKSVSSLPTDD